MSDIVVNVTNPGAANVAVSGGSTVNATVGNGGTVDVSIGTISPGNATVVSGTLTIGTVTTLAAGQSAYVTNNGTAYAAVLEIGLPTGPAGSTPTIAVGTVSTLSAGSNATVTATPSNGGANVTLDFGIPAGASGSAAGATTDASLLTTGTLADARLSANVPLLVNGLIPSNVLPGFVDDVLEYANLAAFPGTGTTGKLYVALDSNKVYRWSGSTYVEIAASTGSLVTSLNNLTGSLTLAAGSNVTITPSGSTLTIDATASGGMGANDAVDGGNYVGELLYGITFTTQPQSQTLNSTTSVNLSEVTVSNHAPVARVASVGNYLLSVEASQTYSSGLYSVTAYPVRSADNGSTWSRCNATAYVNSGSGDFVAGFRSVAASAASNGTRTVMAWPRWQYSDNQDLSVWANSGEGQFEANGGCVAWTGARFIALACWSFFESSGVVFQVCTPYSSSDGVNWTQRTGTGAYSAEYISSVVPKLLPLGSMWYAIGVYTNAFTTWSTSDGMTWTTAYVSGTILKDAASNGSRIVGVNGTTVRYTTNGTSWATGTLPVSCDRISYANGLFWAFNSSAVGTDVCTSSDGVAWAVQTLPSLHQWFDAAATQNGTPFLVGSDTTFARATIGLTYATANLTVSATSASGNPVSYQWQTSLDAGSSWSNVANATNSTLSLVNLTQSDNGTRYRVLATSTGATPVVSQTAILTVTG